jgi:hypothetical protein
MSQDHIEHRTTSTPINIEPSLENIMMAESDQSSTSSTGPWDPDSAKKKHQETKRLLKALQKDFILQQQQAASGTKRARITTDTTHRSNDTVPQRIRSRSRSPVQRAIHRSTRSRSPQPSSRRSQRQRSHSRSPQKSSHERQSPVRDTKTRRSPPRSTQAARSPPRSTPFTSQRNQYARTYNTTAQDRSHNR